MGRVGISLLWLGMSYLLPSYADIRIYRITNEAEMDEYDDAASLFGPTIPSEGLGGVFVYASPANACTNVTEPPSEIPPYINYSNWFLLIKRGDCSFEEKVRNAQEAGYQVAVVHNVNSSSLEPMAADNSTGIKIPSVFIGSEDAALIRRHYLYNKPYFVIINQDVPIDITVHMLLIFSVLVGVCFLAMVIFIVIKYFKDRRHQQRHRLPSSSLKNIPVHKFEANFPYETCVICLEDFVVGEKLRILPCCHAFHMKCIDPWLTRNRRVCPVCKRRVDLGQGVNPTTDDDTDSDDDEETQPLMRGASTPSTSQPTAFQRARRHFLGLAESVASSVSSATSSASASSFYSITAEDQAAERRSLADEPSVNA